MQTNTFAVQIVNANELAAVELLSNTLKKGAAVQVTLKKETKMNKGRGANTNPFIGRVTERTIIGGWSVGTDYSTSCQNAVSRSGSTETFTAKESWHVYFNDFFEVDKATHSKYYLQLQASAKTGTKKETTYYLDGKEVTTEELEAIKQWLPTKTHSQSLSQVEAGVNDEYERKYMVVTLANIERIQQGEFIYEIIKAESPIEATAETQAK